MWIKARRFKEILDQLIVLRCDAFELSGHPFDHGVIDLMTQVVKCGWRHRHQFPMVKTLTTSRVTVAASRPASARKAVIFCCDQNYLLFAAHAAAQISALTPNPDFDICFCFCERPVVLPDSLAHLNVRSCKIDVGDRFKGLRLDKGKSHDVYLRLALPEAFAGEYDRILYLDSDVFIQGGDFNALLDLEFAPYPIAAVRDNSQWRTPNRRPKQFKVLGLPTAKYFNAGVILMDVARYNEQDLLNRCVALGTENADRMIRHDQNLYNSVLLGAWAELHPTWNWQFTWSSRLFALQAEPNLVHFIGKTKPWNDPKAELSPRYARAMWQFAKQHFPEAKAFRTADVPWAPDSAKTRKTLLKHLLSGGKFARLLRRFDHELYVIL